MKLLRNKATGEVHDLDNLHESCNTDDIIEANKERLTFRILLLEAAQGRPVRLCGHCLEGD